MADTLSNYPGYVVARLGHSSLIPALKPAEYGFDTDTRTPRVGDGSNVPGRILSDKSTDVFDFSSVKKITLPGGIVFDGTKPGQAGGVDLVGIAAGVGLLARHDDGGFGAVIIKSSDDTITVTNGRGETNTLDVKLNTDSAKLVSLISGAVEDAFDEFVASQFTQGPTPPANPTAGMWWFDTSADGYGVLYGRISDGTTGAWLELNA